MNIDRYERGGVTLGKVVRLKSAKNKEGRTKATLLLGAYFPPTMPIQSSFTDTLSYPVILALISVYTSLAGISHWICTVRESVEPFFSALKCSFLLKSRSNLLFSNRYGTFFT